ncbi:hypothetical protein [Caudoviricetes sp.]|nr:hypothetical protein [Caudoviricetes sp.]
MHTIYKYELQSQRNNIAVPSGAKFLTAHIKTLSSSNGTTDIFYVYALIDKGKPVETRIIDVYATGQLMPENPGEYIATVFKKSEFFGELVWHIFEYTNTNEQKPT